MAHPTTVHWMALKRVLRYLKRTPSLDLIFHPSTSLDIQAYNQITTRLAANLVFHARSKHTENNLHFI